MWLAVATGQRGLEPPCDARRRARNLATWLCGCNRTLQGLGFEVGNQRRAGQRRGTWRLRRAAWTASEAAACLVCSARRLTPPESRTSILPNPPCE